MSIIWFINFLQIFIKFQGVEYLYNWALPFTLYGQIWQGEDRMALLTDKDSLYKKIQQALKSWYNTSGDEDLLEELLLVRDQQQSNQESEMPVTKRRITNEILLAGMERLVFYEPDLAQTLELRYPDGKTLEETAAYFHSSIPTISRQQQKATQKLADIIWEEELRLREERAAELATFLHPPTYSKLFGVAEAQATLGEMLLANSERFVTTIVGLGGIGKTALADAVVRQIIPTFYFEKILWIRVSPNTMNGRFYQTHTVYDTLLTDIAAQLWPNSAHNMLPNQRVSQVRRVLKERPCLIVIDNLETTVDNAYLLPHLQDLANPSRFLLTTRTRILDQNAVYNFSVQELSLKDAITLIKHHAQESGLDYMEMATPDHFESIYGVTGGNPLALKLVVSLLDVFPLPRILRDLSKSQHKDAEDLYRRIFQRSWKILTPAARHLLKAMPLISETGAEADYLQFASQLDDSQFWPALQELRGRSLLEVRGNLDEKRYGIHRLTETFLRTDIIYLLDEEE